MSEKKSFESNMKRLEEIVSNLENEDIELNKAMKLFEEGLNLVEKCDNELKQFDETINQIIMKHEKGKEHEE
ncbi:MAG: exodeoxyribonuclease VII small subunit [Erysipelotrichales bacterium]|nr:exodeoxyribonuclease VII small subunit [Erysipelotrichales bacterium]